MNLDTGELPLYWYRFPNSLGRRLANAHQEFVREVLRINRDSARLRPVHVTFGSSGRMGTGHVPSQEARAARFREICEWFIREVLGALVEHLTERGIRGDKTIKEFQKIAGEFVCEAFKHNWRHGYAGGDDDKLFWNYANETIEIQTANLRSLFNTVRPLQKRKLDPKVQRIKAKVRQLRKEGCDCKSICNRLGSYERPPRAGWRDLSWPAAYKRHTAAVTKWLSEACS